METNWVSTISTIHSKTKQQKIEQQISQGRESDASLRSVLRGKL